MGNICACSTDDITISCLTDDNIIDLIGKPFCFNVGHNNADNLPVIIINGNGNRNNQVVTEL